MSVGVLEDVAADLDGGDEFMADETIWVDSAQQPWRYNRFTGNHEALTGDGWIAGSPYGPLRKAHSVPAPPANEGVSVHFTEKADENTYFVKGDTGKSAYQIAVELGFLGTVEEWIESLKGEEGPSGEGFPIYGETPIGNRNGSNLIFATVHPYTANSVVLYYNGLRERPGYAYIESGPQEITITTAPESDDDIIIDYLKA